MDNRKRKILHIILTISGILLVILGSIGIVVPVLPTTPFLLLALACFSISSPKLARSIEKNRIFGSYISHWRTHQGIPLKIKVRAIMFLWITLVISACIVQHILIWAILGIIGTIVSIHLVLIKPKPESNTEVSQLLNKEIGQCPSDQ